MKAIPVIFCPCVIPIFLQVLPDRADDLSGLRVGKANRCHNALDLVRANESAKSRDFAFAVNLFWRTIYSDRATFQAHSS
jgi:hypothetical protein